MSFKSVQHPLIKVEGVGKQYTIGHENVGGSLRERIHDTATAIFRPGTRKPKSETFWALQNINFDVHPGEVLGIIGRNGAGKSTLLKILSRITEPTTGRVTLRGRVASLLEVGTGFHPELTGRENIFLNGTILGMTRAEIHAKFDEIVSFAEVERFLDTPVKRYSSGMYVRLAFAVAAHLDPEILIVDEVLAVGDVAFQKKCLDRLQAIAGDEQRAVLLVSHNLNAVLQLCTKVLFLADGQLRASGDPADVVRGYFGSLKPTTPVTSLALLPRSGALHGAARLLSARLADAEKSSDWQIPFGHPISLEFRICVTRRLDELEIGLGLFHLQGFELCSSLSSWSHPLGPIEAGDYQLKISYPTLPLLPGTYRIGVGLRSERDLEDYLPEAFELEITESPLSARRKLSSVRGALAFEITATLQPIPETP